MEKTKKINLTGNEIVVQDNNFLDSKKNLTLQEYKLFMFLISKIDYKKDSVLSTFRISASEFAKAIGLEFSNYIYRDLQNVTKKIMERVVTIHKKDNKQIIQTHLISSAHYYYGNGYVDMKISDEIKPYLLKLHKEFTQYKLSQITTLTSIYAIRLYEMLKKYETIGKRTFFIDDLKKKLNITDSEYKQFNDFKKRVLEIAKREINAKTDLKIDFNLIKTGRKFTAIQFVINAKNKEKIVKYDKNESIQKIKLFSEIIQFGFTKKTVESLIMDLSNTEIENAINAVQNQIKKGNSKNPKAMIRTALKEKWNITNAPNKNQETNIAKNKEKMETKKQSFSIFKKIKKIFS